MPAKKRSIRKVQSRTAELEAKVRELERQLAGVRRQAADPAGTAEATNGGVVVGGNVQSGSAVVTARQLILKVTGDAAWLKGVLGARPSARELRRRLVAYLEYLHDRHVYADFRGMGVSGAVPLRLRLADIYVPLRARVEMPEGETWGRELLSSGRRLPEEDHRILGERFSSPRSVEELFQANPGLVVLGDPGSGKTTFLKQLAVQYSTGQGVDRRFPVFVPLAAFANRLAQPSNTPPPSLEDYIPEYFREEGLSAEMGIEFKNSLKRGTALVLLDGLDEVRSVALRRRVVDQVQNLFLLHQGHGNKFVLTSRIVGYKEVRLNLEKLEECTLADFDRDDMEVFAARWTRAVEAMEKGAGQVASQDAQRRRLELLAAVDNNPGVRRLASNPLLLTILSLMQKAGIPFPNRRAELYEHCLKTMLSTWNVARSMGRLGLEERDVVQTRKTLGPLALWMHESSNGLGLVKEAEFRRTLAKIFLLRAIAPRREDEALQGERDRADADALDFLKDVRGHCGVLLERGEGRYGFIHLTFEEYLAGVGLALLEEERDDGGKPRGMPAVVERVLALADKPEWREAILLAVGYLGLVQTRESAAAGILSSLAQSGPQGALLAGEAILDVGVSGVGRDCYDQVFRRLCEVWDRRELPIPVRAEAGRILGFLGDPRKGVATCARAEGSKPARRPDFAWCGPDPEDPRRPFPAGPFLMGGDPKAFNASKEPLHCTRVSQPFYIARYPVTVAQYQLFVEDGGYERDEFWPGAAREWRDGKAVDWDWSFWRMFIDNYLQERFPIGGPKDRDAVFQSPNHPRVGVSWFEASAFCLWLAKTFPPEEWGFGRKVQVRLATEAEWELAARWSGQAADRVFPWGDSSQVDIARRCNWAETGLNQTSPVGLFSPLGDALCGAADMAGNSWEWCQSRGFDLSDIREYGRFNELSDLDSPHGQEERVLRGGSWFNFDRDYLRCAARIFDHPAYRFSGIGFRCVLVCGLASGG